MTMRTSFLVLFLAGLVLIAAGAYAAVVGYGRYQRAQQIVSRATIGVEAPIPEGLRAQYRQLLSEAAANRDANYENVILGLVQAVAGLVMAGAAGYRWYRLKALRDRRSILRSLRTAGGRPARGAFSRA